METLHILARLRRDGPRLVHVDHAGSVAEGAARLQMDGTGGAGAGAALIGSRAAAGTAVVEAAETADAAT